MRDNRGLSVERFWNIPKRERQLWRAVFLPDLQRIDLDWMHQTMEKRWTFNGTQFLFEGERDAVMFKLRYC